MRDSATRLQAYASQSEQLHLYGNYAPPDTPLEAIYGENVTKLTKMKMEVDPENVMGLAGGFKF